MAVKFNKIEFAIFSIKAAMRVRSVLRAFYVCRFTDRTKSTKPQKLSKKNSEITQKLKTLLTP